MKMKQAAIAAAAALAMGLAPVAPALAQQKTDVRTMDADKDGMISKQEFVRMMEARFDAMDKAKTGKLSPQQVQQVIDSIGKEFGYNP